MLARGIGTVRGGQTAERESFSARCAQSRWTAVGCDFVSSCDGQSITSNRKHVSCHSTQRTFWTATRRNHRMQAGTASGRCLASLTQVAACCNLVAAFKLGFGIQGVSDTEGGKVGLPTISTQIKAEFNCDFQRSCKCARVHLSMWSSEIMSGALLS